MAMTSAQELQIGVNNMNQNYTNNQAMAKLDLTSRSAFYHMKRKFPHAFVVVHQRIGSGNVTLYDKQALDKFVEMAKSSKSKGQR
jgi:hypothetical protein